MERILVRAELVFHDGNRPLIFRTPPKERRFATAELINGAYKAPLLGLTAVCLLRPVAGLRRARRDRRSLEHSKPEICGNLRNLRIDSSDVVALQFVVPVPLSLPCEGGSGRLTRPAISGLSASPSRYSREGGNDSSYIFERAESSEKPNRPRKQKLRQGDKPGAAVSDYPLLVKGHDRTCPLWLRIV